MQWVQFAGTIYWIVFGIGFLAVAFWETRWPERNVVGLERRWTRHGTLMLVGYISVYLICRTNPVVLAVALENSRFGLFTKLGLPTALRWIIGFLVLDLVRFVLHWAHHAIYPLWRIHRVHHSDPDFDVSTSARFHPIEIVIAQVVDLGVIALLAPPAGAVLLAVLATCAQSLFVHANATLPAWLERRVWFFLITPDLHRIHHSQEVPEQSTNFGEILPWWDMLFGTFRRMPAAGREGWTPGLVGYQTERSLELGFMLKNPFMQDGAEASEVASANAGNAPVVQPGSSGRP